MERFQIDCTDGSPLVFDGELLAKFTSPQHETEDGQRGYELALYNHAEGGFVVSIKYLTTCPHEQSVVQAEIVDDPQDVEAVLLFFEPCAPVGRHSKRAWPDEKRRKLRKALYRIYDSETDQLLSVLTKHCGDWDEFPASDENKVETKKSGILSFFRLK